MRLWHTESVALHTNQLTLAQNASPKPARQAFENTGSRFFHKPKIGALDSNDDILFNRCMSREEETRLSPAKM
jgi:hypothetical protein